jgi:hypothetical protein
MAGAAGGVGPIGVTEVHTAANAIAIRAVAVDLATRIDFDLDSIADLRWRWIIRAPGWSGSRPVTRR